MSGKQLSLASKIFAGVFVLVAFILGVIFRWGTEPWDIIQIGMFFALVFAPVDVSKIAEKFGKRQS